MRSFEILNPRKLYDSILQKAQHIGSNPSMYSVEELSQILVDAYMIKEQCTTIINENATQSGFTRFLTEGNGDYEYMRERMREIHSAVQGEMTKRIFDLCRVTKYIL